MNNLNELAHMAKLNAENFSTEMTVRVTDILAIAEAFRALEHRAEAAEEIVSDVNEVIGLLSEREWAEHCTKTETGRRLEELITELHDDAAQH